LCQNDGIWTTAASQVKCCIDQQRVPVVPDGADWKTEPVSCAGIGDANNPVIFSNVRIAVGRHDAHRPIDEGRKDRHARYRFRRQQGDDQGAVDRETIAKLMKERPELNNRRVEFSKLSQVSELVSDLT
jgi:hypothetical protein